MSTLKSFSKAPQCLFCVRRFMADDITGHAFPFHRQLRGKKKTSKEPVTLKVKLLRDIRGYGREGSIIPVAPGRMRNMWYPQNKAQYMTAPQLKEAVQQGVVIEREYTFDIEPKESSSQTEEEAEHSEDVQLKLLHPFHATELIASIVPRQLVFYRPPLSIPEPSKPFRSSSASQSRLYPSSAAADLAAASEGLAEPAKPEPIGIYGSVTTADIATSVKAALSQTEEGARVVLGPEDFTIIKEQGSDSGAEADRVKTLGNFQVDIQVKGGGTVRRVISVEPRVF